MTSPREKPGSSFSITVSAFQARLLPGLAVFLSVLSVFYCLLLYDAPTQLFRDSDTGWHIRNGETILRDHKLPTTDPYSFSKAGERWYAWEWGADVIMGWAHQRDGMRGVVLLYLALICGCTYLWVRLHWAVGGNFLFACLLASPMLTTVNLHWLARPHLFSWVLLLGAVLWLESVPTVFKLRHALGIVVGAALWTNLHASFPLAVILPVLYCFSYSITSLLYQVDADEYLAKARYCLFAAPLALLATLLNPMGIGVHLHIAAYLANSALLARIAEFQSFNFHSDGAWQIVATLIVAMAGAIAALSTGRFPAFVLTLLLIAGSLRAARGLPVLALIALPLANGAITEWLTQIPKLRASMQLRITKFLEYFARLYHIDNQLRGWIWLPLTFVLVWVILHAPAAAQRIGFPASEFPVTAAVEIAKLPDSARILAPDKYGGYLIYRFNGKRKVYFDGRSDFYGLDFMKEYIRLTEARPGWPQIIDNYAFSHALLPKEYSLIPALERRGWEKIYEDSVCVLLRRNF